MKKLLSLALAVMLFALCFTACGISPDEPDNGENGGEIPEAPDPNPDDPTPDDPAPENPEPEDPNPDDPAPEDPDPEDPAPEHIHTYSEEWSYDEVAHWHVATCAENAECRKAISGEEAHDFADGDKCKCGYKKPVEAPKPEILGELKSEYGLVLGNGTKIDANYYPGFVRKALSFTIDDGVVAMDKLFLEIVRPVGIKGTFNLCDTDRLTAEEYRLLYEGYEVANHNRIHALPFRDDFDYSEIEIKDEVFNSSTSDPAYMYKDGNIEGLYYIDFRHYTDAYDFAYWHPIATDETYIKYVELTAQSIESVFGEGSVVGYAYPHGAVNEYIKKYLKENGYLYARDTGSILDKTGFSLPTDRYAWTYNADHTNLLSAMALYDAYGDDGELKFFSFGVHASDYKNSWDMLREFAATYGNRADEFYYATNREIFEYEDAVRSLIITDESITNPSAVSVYLTVNDIMVHLPAGATYVLEPTEEAPDYEITFEDIDRESLPKSLTVSLSSTVAKEIGVLISEVTKNGKEDKVFTLTTGADGSDKITVRRNLKSRDYTAVTFKSDLLIDTAVNAVQYYTIEFKSPTGTVVYHLNLKCDDEGKIAFDDFYRYNGEGVYTVSSSGSGYTTEMMGNWFTLTLEVSKNGEGNTVLRIFADGKQVATCTHKGFYNVPLDDYSAVEITAGAGTEGTLSLDNISLKQTERLETEKEKDPVAEIMPVKGGANGVIILIHDDGDITSAKNLDALYEKYGLVGDVALIANRVWDTEVGAPIVDAQKSWQALFDNGRWGLINHSMTHAFPGSSDENGFSIDADKLYSEIVTSGEVLRRVFPGQRVLTFAYPGFSSVTNVHGKYPTMKEAVSLVCRHYIGGRNYKGGVQSVDKLIYGFTNGRTLGGSGSDMEQIDAAANGKGASILVFLMHQVWESGASGNAIPVSSARRAIERISDHVYEGRVWSAHFEDALLYLAEAECAKVTSEVAENGIALNVTDSLDDSVYNYPFTVKVKTPSDWKAVKLTQGERVFYALTVTENGETYAYVDVTPDGGEALVTPSSAEEVPEEFLPKERVPHTSHTYSEEWSFDENGHWHAASCDERISCGEEKADLAPHEYGENGVCVCGCKDPLFGIDKNGYYYKNVINGSELGFDYNGFAYANLSVRNSSAVHKFLNISSQMNDYKSSTYGMITDLEGNSVLMRGKEPGTHRVSEMAFYNLNQSDKNCVVFESRVMFAAADSDQITQSGIYFSRFGFVSEYNRDDNIAGIYTTSKMLDIAEVYGAFDPETDKWGEIKYKTKTFDPTEWYVITMEYYRSEGVIRYYVDGELINTVGVGANLDCNNVVFQLQGQAYGSAVYFDNTYFGSVDKTLEGELPDVPHVHTYSETLTYDEKNHWYAATCAENDTCATAKKDVTAHSFGEDHLCECGYENPAPDGAYPDYFTTQGALGEKTAVYTGWTYWKYCTHNEGSYLKFLTNSSAAGDIVTTHTHGLVHTFEDGNAAFKIGKTPAANSAHVAQTQFANLNSADKNCFVFESDIMFDIVSGAAVAQENLDSKNRIFVSRLSVLANPENVRDYSQYSSMMPKNEEGNSQYFEITGEYDLEAKTWKSFGIGDMTLENGKWYKMTIEYYKAEGVMRLFVNGNLVQTVVGLAGDYVPTSGLVQLQGLAYGSSVYVDNTYVGTVDKTYSEE